MLLSSMRVYHENTNIGEKRINKKRQGTPPLNPPSMGEYIQQFPSLEGCRLRQGGVPFTAGRVPLFRHPEASFFEAVRISSDAADVILSGAFPREDLIFSLQIL
jgi:hypothetical protein